MAKSKQNENDPDKDAVAPATVLSDEQHDQNRVMLLELELEEAKRENERLKAEAIFSPKVAAPVPVVDLSDMNDPAYNSEGPADELILVEAVFSGMASDHDRAGRPAWAHCQMVGRREEGGVRFPGRVFRMRREEVNSCLYNKKHGTGWVRVLRPGEQLRSDLPIGPMAPQTSQLGAKISGSTIAGALPIGT